MRVYIARWSRLFLAIAALAISVSLVKADHKVADLQREAPYDRAQRERNTARIDRLEAQIRVIRRQGHDVTTTTGTTVPGRPVRRKRAMATTAGTTTTRTPDQIIVPPKPEPPKPCTFVVPIAHSCIMAALRPPSIRLGP